MAARLYPYRAVPNRTVPEPWVIAVRVTVVTGDTHDSPYLGLKFKECTSAHLSIILKSFGFVWILLGPKTLCPSSIASYNQMEMLYIY